MREIDEALAASRAALGGVELRKVGTEALSYNRKELMVEAGIELTDDQLKHLPWLYGCGGSAHRTEARRVYRVIAFGWD